MGDFQRMDPVPDNEADAAEAKAYGKSKWGWKVAGIAAIAGVAGYIGSGIKEGLNLSNFFTEGSRGANQTLKSGEEKKIFGATVKLDGWTLRLDSTDTQKFLKENPGRNIRFRILKESGGEDIHVVSYANDYEGIPDFAKSTARDISNFAKTIGLQGLKDPESGHLGILKQDFFLKPEYGGKPVLLVEEEIQNGKESPEIQRTMIVLEVEKTEYQMDDHLSVTSEKPLSEAELDNINNFVTELRTFIDKKGDTVSEVENVEVCNTNRLEFESGFGGALKIPSKFIDDQKALNKLIPTLVHMNLASEVSIQIDDNKSADALLKLHKFVNGAPIKMEWGGDWWGFVRNPNDFHKCILLSEYVGREKDEGLYIDSPQFFVAGIEAIARLYPEEFKKRYLALSSSDREKIQNCVKEIVEPMCENSWRRPLEIPKLIRSINKE